MDKDTYNAQLAKRKEGQEDYDDASSYRSGYSMSKGGPKLNYSIHEDQQY